MNELLNKYESLKESLGKYTAEGLVIAFSGGVDSGFLLWAAEEARREYGGKLVALTANSDSMPRHDKDDVEKFLKHVGVRHVWRNSSEVDDPEYAKNDSLRCYYCKTELFSIAKQVADEYDCRRIVYGYSASDKSDVRPGHRAALENDILFPLADNEFTKSEIRDLMRVNGLELHDKPSSPCLSSRIMRGVQITKTELRDVDDLETLLRRGGMKIFRLRVHELKGRYFLRLETAPEEMTLALQLREKLAEEAKKRGYLWVTLDLEGYKTGGGTTS
ncbi:MAG: ATP-dependent sacrificial sulfur transferase LarE [Bacteroidetes bacterium]|nr:ATP-dependent sacrificial sulfur transferase LarE [Bacteroidota bacterium]MCL5737540.1 ATP-dependent sacrificial sulfur transferase LarE [Bacteroidota bacterium]